MSQTFPVHNHPVGLVCVLQLACGEIALPFDDGTTEAAIALPFISHSFSAPLSLRQRMPEEP